jgi:hypothetical protein
VEEVLTEGVHPGGRRGRGQELEEGGFGEWWRRLSTKGGGFKGDPLEFTTEAGDLIVGR